MLYVMNDGQVDRNLEVLENDGLLNIKHTSETHFKTLSDTGTLFKDFRAEKDHSKNQIFHIWSSLTGDLMNSRPFFRPVRKST